MKIVIDATALLDQYSKRGIGTYTKGILHELLKNKDHEWHILGFLERKDNFSAIGMDPTKHSNVFFHSLGPVRKSNLMNFFYSDKTIKTLLSKIQPDMFFSPNFERGVWTGKWKKIVMIHDIIPVTNNSFSQKGVFFNFFKKIFYLDRLKKALNSDLILTNSEFSKGMIARNFKVDPKKIIPIPLAIDNNLKTNPERLSKIKLESYGIRNNYLLYYGGLEQNKNIEYLLKVFSLLSKEITDISLVIVSSEFLKKSRKETIANTKTAQKLLDSAKKLAIFEKVVFTQVLDDDLPLVLKNSKAFIHLSRQEGFGLSVLEAISMGVPCIVSDIPVYREFFEDGVKFVPLNDTEQTSQTILRLLKFDNDLVKLAEKGKKISEKFGWITTANLTMQAIQNLSEGKFNQKPIDKNSVTFISPYFFPYKGGVENYTFDIARRLVDNGFCVDVLTSKFEKKQKKFQDIRGIKVHRFQTFINQYYLRFYPGLLFHLFRSRSQIFHVQGIGFIWQDFCLLIKKFFGMSRIKIICTPHGPFMARSGYSPFQKFLKKIFVFFQRIYLNWLYDSVIAVNPNQNNWLISEYKINPNKIKFLPIGIDQHHFDQIDTMTVRNELFFDEKDVIGTYVGRFHSYKGVMDILKSLKILRSEFPDLKFVFMGKDAGELNKMRAYISKFNLKNTVKILITPSDEKRDQILELSDFFVFPSEWEAYGIATIEAMAHKNAIITTKTEGSLHLINDKINGLFIEYNNPESIAKAIQKILSNPKLLRKMKNNNFEKVKQITWSNIWTEYVELYNSFTV